jgi:S-DNA-T family DNA segregation ATPase FtsK/SpoIIIE
MAPRGRKPNPTRSLKDLDFRGPVVNLSPVAKRRIGLVALTVFGILATLSLFDAAGTLGVYLNAGLLHVFGVLRWLTPVLCFGILYILLRPSKFSLGIAGWIGVALLVLTLNALIHVIAYGDILVDAALAGQGGGLLGLVLGYPLLRLTGFWACVLLLLGIGTVGGIMLHNVMIGDHEVEPGSSLSWLAAWRNRMSDRKVRQLQEQRERVQAPGVVATVIADEDVAEELGFSPRPMAAAAQPAHEADDQLDDAPATSPETDALNQGVRTYRQTKIDIPFDLLDGRVGTPDGGDLKSNQLLVQKTLSQFGVEVEMGDATVGPTVTQYTFKPAPGVRLSKIVSLQDNLALALAAHPIRIEAPIPGKSLVGLEIPNHSTATVPLRLMFNGDEFKQRKSDMMIALGADVMGKPWFADLVKMPHLLIAGSTGSGKSVCINTLILSLLYQNGPGQLKFIMVDPKRVELPIYNGIPHLITPVITDVKKTVNALRWTVGEMDRRFEMLAQVHKRNIESYNAEAADKLPYIVVIIDELADLMAAAAAEVEAAIIRLAQMSRAVGIHLVLATQRPSVDVLTGLIKANITSRIAFSVASAVDSRTILDTMGAEKLLGRGDMLFISSEMGKPKRLQGCFASDQDIKRVIDFLRTKDEPEYISEVTEQPSGVGMASGGGDDGDGDPLLDEAKQIIFQARKASASLLQRRLRVGYARAARLLDLLEQQGVIGPGDGAKPREILSGATMPVATAPLGLGADRLDDEDDFEGMDARPDNIDKYPSV